MKIILLFIAVISLTLVNAQSYPPAPSPLPTVSPTVLIPEHRSCKEGCRAYDINKDGGLCKCDSDCGAYGDCCGPSPTRRPRGCRGTVQDVHLQGLQFTCRSIFLDSEIKDVMKHEAFWMVSRCSSDWLVEAGDSGQMVLDGCTNEARDLPPVTDANTGIVYKNQHCALCNHVEDTVPWSSNIVCTPYLYDLLETTPISQINVSLFQAQCRPCSYLRPNSVRPPRACYPTEDTMSCFAEPQLRNCVNGSYDPWVGTFMSDNCTFRVRAYRNRACADCNGKSRLQLVERFRDTNSVPRQCKPNVTIPEVDLTPVTTSPPKSALASVTEHSNYSIRILYSPRSTRCSNVPSGIPFTIAFSNLGEGLVSITTKGESVSMPFKCPQGQAPVGLRCINTICPVNFMSVDGRCFSRHAISGGNQSTNESGSGLFINCPTELVPLNDTGYTKLSNRTVLVDGIVKEILHYRDGIPLICPNNNNTFFSYPVGFLELTYVGCSLSVIGSALILITYGLFKELRSLPSKILMNLAFANLWTNLLLLIGGPLTQAFPITQLCTAVAILLHFFFLVQFAWMSVMSFDVVRKFNQARKLTVDSKHTELRLLVIYAFVGWGVPLLISTVSLIINFTTAGLVLYGVLADGSLGFCWINHLESAVITFVVPLVLSLSFHLVMFIVATFYICMAARSQAKLERKGGTPLFHLNIAIFCTTGLTWIFGFIAILAGTSWVWYPFIIFNSTQGFVIFIAFLFTKKTLKLYIRCLTCKKAKDLSKSLIKETRVN